MVFRSVFVAALLLCASTGFAQPAARAPHTRQTSAAAPAEPPPSIRRWFDLQNAHLMSRFRWIESNTGRLTSSTHQWQPQLRGRFLIDPDARYSINFNAQSGSQFVSGWNNSGGGVGTFAGDFNVKQLFLGVQPVPWAEVHVGGLQMARGESTEITSYDNDAYIVGERATFRRARGVLSQVVATLGYIGDYHSPSVFDRLKRLDEWNYGQLLFGVRLGPRTTLSADYTFENGRDILRQALTLRMPTEVRWLRSVKLEAYQRVSDVNGGGGNVSGDFRLTPAFTVTTGITHIDQHYLIPGYMSPNADRYERGTRFYSQGNYQLTRDVSVGWFHTEAFNVDYVIPNEHRWEILVTFNPTATLKAKRIF